MDGGLEGSAQHSNTPVGRLTPSLPLSGLIRLSKSDKRASHSASAMQRCRYKRERVLPAFSREVQRIL